MAVALSKGGNVSLSKEAPGMKKAIIGLSWDARETEGQDFDLDASAFLLDASGKCIGDASFIYYNNLKTANGSVEHTGDERTGASEGDDEQIIVNLENVDANVDKIAVAVTIHDCGASGQNFGQVRNAAIRVVNADNNEEVVKYDLSEDYSTQTAMVFGELYKRNDEWKFKAVGEGHTTDNPLGKLCEQYGLTVG